LPDTASLSIDLVSKQYVRIETRLAVSPENGASPVSAKNNEHKNAKWRDFGPAEHCFGRLFLKK
jgi:hypothetical protein